MNYIKLFLKFGETQAERTQAIKGLGVAAGGSAVESASTMSTDHGEGMREAQIQGFTDDKVREA